MIQWGGTMRLACWPSVHTSSMRSFVKQPSVCALFLLLILAVLHMINKQNKWTYPALGPLSVRSKTCRGFSSHWNLCIRRVPWFPPLRGLTKTSNGWELGLGTGLMTNVLPTPPVTTKSSEQMLDSRRLDDKRRRFRTDDLNKLCTGQNILTVKSNVRKSEVTTASSTLSNAVIKTN